MRFLLKISLIVVLGYLAGLFLPWWSVVLVAALVCLALSEKAKRRYGRNTHSLSFLAGFLAVFLLWGGLAFFTNQQNDAILGKRIAELIFQKPTPILAVIASAFIGGLVGGFGAMTGGLLGKIWREGTN